MKIITNILSDFIKVPKDLDVLTSDYIVEVENYRKMVDASKILVGKVLSCLPHPDADKLSVTTVDVGKEILQIVCGAPNVAKNQFVIVALVGAVLPGDFEIKNATIRGVDSFGMICSLSELGLDKSYLEEDAGIYVFEQLVKIGDNPLRALGLDTKILELDLTPNRSDLLSHRGFAYDLAAALRLKVRDCESIVVEQNTPNPIELKVETNLVFEYNARVFNNVKVKPSPWWLKSALIASGISPVNNVVDISNYILIKYGTPLHMFDASKVKSQKIVVRIARGEKVQTLDGKTHLLTDDIVITNGEEVIAIGGVMGLESTMIDDHTTSIILEAALFDEQKISQTSKRLDLRSDSSLRFERGVDQKQVMKSLEHAAKLLVDIAEATVCKGVKTVINRPYIPVTINILRSKFSLLGKKLHRQTLESYFRRLGYTFSYDKKKSEYVVTIPSYRHDIKIPADLIEEIARIHGYNNIPSQELANFKIARLTNRQQALRDLRKLLANRGLNEIISYSLIKTEEVALFTKSNNPVKIKDPMTADRAVMRQSLLNGILKTVSYNQARKQGDLSLFEIGSIYSKGEEKLCLAIGLTGNMGGSKWQKRNIEQDFYYLKGLLQLIGDYFNAVLKLVASDENPGLHPGRQAQIICGDITIGEIGQTHPLIDKNHHITPTYVLNMELDEILKQKNKNYQAVSIYPEVTRDLAVVVDKKVLVNDIYEMIRQTAKKSIVKLELFDIYISDELGKAKQSLAFGMTFYNDEKTMTTAEIDKIIKSIVSRLSYEFGAIVRN